jgi:hypothetical protein
MNLSECGYSDEQIKRLKNIFRMFGAQKVTSRDLTAEEIVELNKRRLLHRIDLTRKEKHVFRRRDEKENIQRAFRYSYDQGTLGNSQRDCKEAQDNNERSGEALHCGEMGKDLTNSF